MLRKICLLGVATSLLAFASVQAQSVDDLIAKHLDAVGGVEKLKSIQSMKITGTSAIPAMGVTASFTRTSMRPNMMRMDVQVQGQTMVQAYDGETAWQIVPFGGDPTPQAMPEAQAKYFRMQADLDGMLVDFKKKGHKIEFIGKEPVEEKDAYNLKVTMNTGDVTNIYLDTESYLQVKSRLVTPGPGGNNLEIDSYFSDFKTVDGMTMAHTITQNNPMQGKVETKMTEVQVNPEVDKSIFQMPSK
ncbi:hypothetical protein KC734_12985 [candidate division KSB1 bacterium]|nr:hypothetical protein [candidate division KSB1 bacterium]